MGRNETIEIDVGYYPVRQGDEQRGLTYYTTDPESAQSYANSFAPAAHIPTWDKPAYIVSVKHPGEQFVKHVEGVGSHEVGVTKPITSDDVVDIYRGDVVSYVPEEKQTGWYSAPSARLRWTREPIPRRKTVKK